MASRAEADSLCRYRIDDELSSKSFVLHADGSRTKTGYVSEERCKPSQVALVVMASFVLVASSLLLLRLVVGWNAVSVVDALLAFHVRNPFFTLTFYTSIARC